jgi:hypothetical protein
VLKSDPAPVAPPPPAPAGGATADAASADPIVSLVSDDEDSGKAKVSRRVLGERKDPFRHTNQKKVKPVKTSSSSSSTPSQQTVPTTGGGSAPSTGSAPVVATPTPAPKPKKTYALFSIDVRFSSGDGSTTGTLTSGTDDNRQTVKRLGAIPSDDQPLLVYLGVKDNGNTAIFMVDASATPSGDGTCVPKETCEKLELRAGDTEFFDVKDDSGQVTGQYELDLLKIHKSKNG